MINKIISLIRPPEDPINTGNLQLRKEVSYRLGIELPEDYFSLIDNYGSGIFCDCIRVYNPYSNSINTNIFHVINVEKALYNDSKNYFNADKFNEHPKILEYFKKQMQLIGASGIGYPFNFYPSKNGLIPWGSWDSTYTFYWNTSFKPWTVVVYGEDEFYFEFNMSMTEFLFKLFTDDIVLEGNKLQQKSFVKY